MELAKKAGLWGSEGVIKNAAGSEDRSWVMQAYVSGFRLYLKS